MKLNVLSNSRPTEDLGEVLVVACTEGQLKVSPNFAELLKVTTGDRIGVGRDPEDKSKIYAFKATEDSDLSRGNKLARSGSFYNMSSANVWQELEGDVEFNQYYKVVGEVIEDEDGLFVQIEFDYKEEKQSRKSSDKDNSNSAKEEVEEVDFEVTEEEDDDAPMEV